MEKAESKGQIISKQVWIHKTFAWSDMNPGPIVQPFDKILEIPEGVAHYGVTLQDVCIKFATNRVPVAVGVNMSGTDSIVQIGDDPTKKQAFIIPADYNSTLKIKLAVPQKMIDTKQMKAIQNMYGGMDINELRKKIRPLDPNSPFFKTHSDVQDKLLYDLIQKNQRVLFNAVKSEYTEEESKFVLTKSFTEFENPTLQTKQYIAPTKMANKVFDFIESEINKVAKENMKTITFSFVPIGYADWAAFKADYEAKKASGQLDADVLLNRPGLDICFLVQMTYVIWT
jgi:hypothetical protein